MIRRTRILLRNESLDLAPRVVPRNESEAEAWKRRAKSREVRSPVVDRGSVRLVDRRGQGQELQRGRGPEAGHPRESRSVHAAEVLRRGRDRDLRVLLAVDLRVEAKSSAWKIAIKRRRRMRAELKHQQQKTSPLKSTLSLTAKVPDLDPEACRVSQRKKRMDTEIKDLTRSKKLVIQQTIIYETFLVLTYVFFL